MRVVKRGFAPSEDGKDVELLTPHGIKGFDTEIAFVLGVDRCFSRENGVLSNVVYSAMTRARSLLFVTGSLETPQGRPICEAVLQAQKDLDALDYGGLALDR